jgi:L-amino acid N-acyltransferase YncA
MALQAEHFQTYYDYLPDAQYYGFGHGLIQAIIKKREENAVELQALIDNKKSQTIGFHLSIGVTRIPLVGDTEPRSSAKDGQALMTLLQIPSYLPNHKPMN